jgi:hypothetical protein
MAKAKLNQIIAVLPKKKANVDAAKTRVYHKIQKDPHQFMGLIKTYKPKVDGADGVPDQRKSVQYTVNQAVKDFSGCLTELMDVVYSQEESNSKARANIVIDGVTLLENVPVTFLLFLQKQCDDARTFAEKLPTLDSAHEWTYDATSDQYKSETTETNRTSREPYVIKLADPTEHHPEQAEVRERDVVIGTYKSTEFSGKIPEKVKNEMLARITKLQEAVVKAREEANLQEVDQADVGKKILQFMFTGE